MRRLTFAVVCGYVCSTVFDVPTVKEQMDLFSTHGVVVCAHGAGLMNMYMMPPFTAVVEVFPYGTHHNLYGALSAMLGIAHYPVHPSSGTPIWENEKVGMMMMDDDDDM